MTFILTRKYHSAFELEEFKRQRWQDPRKCPWNPCTKAPNFYPDVFGQFLSGKRIWVPTWAISIRTPDMAIFFRQTPHMASRELIFLSFIWFGGSKSGPSIHLSRRVGLVLGSKVHCSYIRRLLTEQYLCFYHWKVVGYFR